jgi:ATP phosphoribosyltransferase regulatory subunit
MQTSSSRAHHRSLVPAGMTTILPRAAQRVRHLEGTLLATVSRWGYQEIIPPTFEYLDVLSPGLEPEVIENSYTFVDRTTGRMLLLRPDVTAQIARIVAMGMVGPGVPLRLCYRTTVFRYEPEHAGREREIFQVGAELIGADDVAMDGEILGLLIECLTQLGLPDFKISLGHVGFFKALLAKSGLSPEARKRAEHAAARKDLPRLEEILREERVSRKNAQAVLEAPGLYGRDEVLERGGRLAGRDQELRAALDRLTQVYRLLGSGGMKDHLLLDLGELRGFDYYDGVVFDVFTDGLGCELGGGGRYNHLIGRFGRDLPSTGFALDVDRLFRSLERVDDGRCASQADVVLVAPPHRRAQLFEVARSLRQAGLRVVQDVTGKARTQAVRAAVEEGHRLAASAAVLLGVGPAAADEALLVTEFSRSPGRNRSIKPAQRKVKIKDIPALL